MIEKLSEDRPTSDRFGGNDRKAVRTSLNFRQVWRKRQKSCQNIAQLQTGLEEMAGKLSEDRPTSDRFGGKGGKDVRRSPNFRQVWRKRQKSCQKMAQLQTGLDEMIEKLSEDRPTSDRFGGKDRKTVRRSPNFRQVWRKRQESCQKIAQLQTGLDGKIEKLSEDRPTSDRFGGKGR
ncbi:MAG: hypothetical protein AB2411_04280, partial [Mesobacillus sp.]